jgi:hypothetical protein
VSVPKPAPVYVSGWCATGQHDRCRGAYAGVDCGCECRHQPAEPEPEPEPATVLPLLLARHCETCACQGHG